MVVKAPGLPTYLMSLANKMRNVSWWKSPVRTFRSQWFLSDSKLGPHAIFREHTPPSLSRNVFSFRWNAMFRQRKDVSGSLKLSHFSGFYLKRATLTRIFAQDFEDEKLKRLFVVYHNARKDFDATPSKTLERTKSAKFLRDTTENCLAYIAAKQTRPGGKVTCDRLLQELRATLEETIAIAEKGSGGKKRRFDENWENVPQEPARMRGRGPSMARPLRKSDPIPRGRTSEKKQRSITSCIEERQVSRKPDYRQQSMSLNLAKRRRSHLPPPQLHLASSGQSVRRVFGDRHKPHAERNPLSGHVYGDRYRPTYKYG